MHICGCGDPVVAGVDARDGVVLDVRDPDRTATHHDRDSLAQERLPIAGVRDWLGDALERPWQTPKSG